MEVLLRFHHVPQIHMLEVYERNGGYQALAKALRIGPQSILELVDESGLRGRGGAGFPTGSKWKAVAAQTRTPCYFICNLAEGEPGSFKDRALVKNPHQVLEATAISAYTIGAKTAYIYLRGSFTNEERMLRHALVQSRTKGWIGPNGKMPVEIVIHKGVESYIAGEETAMIESLEGKPAIPRTKPPRPHEYGLWDSPTLTNNVETICNVISILLHGPQAFRKYGTPQSPGTKLFCLSGQISRPGLYEAELGIQLSELLERYGGGALPGRRLRAVFPGGPSTPIVPVELNPAMDYEGLAKAGSSLGTGGVIVVDDSTDMRALAVETSRFFAQESCGACPPCTTGTGEIHSLFKELQEHASKSSQTVLKIREFCEMMKYRGQCSHCRAAALTTSSLLDSFPEAFQQKG